MSYANNLLWTIFYSLNSQCLKKYPGWFEINWPIIRLIVSSKHSPLKKNKKTRCFLVPSNGLFHFTNNDRFQTPSKPSVPWKWPWPSVLTNRSSKARSLIRISTLEKNGINSTDDWLWKSPLQLVQLQNVASFKEIGQNVQEKLHSQTLGDNWTEIRTEQNLKPYEM